MLQTVERLLERNKCKQQQDGSEKHSIQ